MPSLKALRDAHQQREVDAEDHLRHEDGGGLASCAARRAQAEAARPYAERMERMLRALARQRGRLARPRRRCWSAPGRTSVHLLIAVTADRGLAGAFNTNVGRATRDLVRAAGSAKARRSRSWRSAARAATTCAASIADRIVGDIT